MVFEGNVRWQVLLLAIIAVTVFTRVLPLEMQKRIVNQAISLRKLDLLLTILRLLPRRGDCLQRLQVPDQRPGDPHLPEGARPHADIAPGAHHLSALEFFRNTQPGTVVNAVANELAVPSNFVGSAVSTPVSNVLTLLAFAGYLFWLNPLLAAFPSAPTPPP